MRIFKAEEVDNAFIDYSPNGMELEEDLARFESYEKFERYMRTHRRPAWINFLIAFTECKSRADLYAQWYGFSAVFKKYHEGHIEHLHNPESCPEEIQQAREEELRCVVESFARQERCHWKRDHRFICFCEE